MYSPGSRSPGFSLNSAMLAAMSPSPPAARSDASRGGEGRPAGTAALAGGEHRRPRRSRRHRGVHASGVGDRDRLVRHAHHARGREAPHLRAGRRSSAAASALARASKPSVDSGARSGVSRVSGPGRPGKSGSFGAALAAATRCSTARCDRVVIGAVGRRDADLRAEDRSHREGDVCLGHVLMDAVACESRERRCAARSHGLGLVGLGELDSACRQLAKRVGSRVHRPTPVSTPLKRAGAAPWATWATCIGSPLPQLATPHTSQ